VEPVAAMPAPVPPPAIARPIEQPIVHPPPEVGLFDRSNGTRTTQAAAAITTGGFGTASTATRGAPQGAVTTGGFGSAPAARTPANGPVGVQAAGFDVRPSVPHGSAVTSAKPDDRPVEIVFKPAPEYTDEARAARIEGTVSLELEFTAAGEVRVLRVVRGLGHGLDEAARQAALRIRFKPAQSGNGQPVDSRATVHITFRLS
jgi:TonB family protein